MIRRLPLFSRLFNLNDSGWGRGNSGSGGDGQEPPRRPPQSGNNGGPPDLDELWRDLSRKLNGFGKGGRRGPQNPFGGGNNNGGSGNFQPPSAKSAGIGLGAIVGVGVLIWLASGFFIVPEGQVGVVTQFGAYKSTTPAGFQWRFPAPIQDHELVNVSQLRTIEVGFRGNSRTRVSREALMITDDENIVDLQWVVQYRIRPDGAPDFLFNHRSPDEAVFQAAESAMREIVGRQRMDFVLYEGRIEIAQDAVRLMQQMMDIYRTGILISSVAIQNAQPPEQVQAAFDDAVRASQDRERAINEGEAYANDVIPRARGTASRIVQEAEAHRSRVVEMAQGDAARFNQILAAYATAPGVTRDRLFIETMQQVLGNTSKVLVDSSNNNQMLYLPLDRMMQSEGLGVPRSTASSAMQPAAAAGAMMNSSPTTAPAPTAPESRRDALRAREPVVR